MAPRRGWCKHCLDDYRQGDVIVRCSSCPRTFHRECLDHDLLTNSTQSVYYQNNSDNPMDLTDFTCDSCLQYAQESEIVNDERCKICKERNRDESDVLLLCDGCPNSYHMSCLNLQVEPDSDKWYCPMCKPEAFEGVNVRMQRRNPLTDTSDHVNSSICYVCQRHGKLLGCDFCPNSFHYDCLPEFDIDTIADVWECPCCRGEDPFINQMHKRWTISQIEKNSKTRRKSIMTWKGVITRYRNRFILAHREELSPFVTTKIMDQLVRSFISNRIKSKKDKLRDVENQLELLQEEQQIESNKFVIKARKSCYYPSGRKKDSRPMRTGVSLKPHQEDGVDWLLKSFLTGGAILADEMGLGKTIQTLCFLSYLKMMNIEGPHLIVVPLSTVGNWLREIHRFTPHLTVVKICGSRTERLHAMSDRLAYNGLYDLFVTTYETVKCEEAFFVETVPRWQCLILDEAHRIKNQSGALRHSMDRIVSNMRLLLTGTPLQNNAQELFTLINFMFPDLFRDSHIMEQAFNSKKRVRNDDEMKFTAKELESIKLLLSRIMLRRLKEQAISLPRKIFHDVWLPLSEETLKWYRTLMNIRSLMRENLSIKKLLGIVIKMRIICGHPRGIVSRTLQRDKLFEFFKQEDLKVQKQIESDANELNDMKGMSHVHASAKLTFLDKLLCQLHFENCALVPNYHKTFNQHLKSLDQSLYRHFLNTSSEAVSKPEEPEVVKSETSSDSNLLNSKNNGNKDKLMLDMLGLVQKQQYNPNQPLLVDSFKLVNNTGFVKPNLLKPELKLDQLNFKPPLQMMLLDQKTTPTTNSLDAKDEQTAEVPVKVEEQGENGEEKNDKGQKKKKKKISKEEFLSKVQNHYVRVPQNTSETKFYLSDSLKEVNLSQNCPYVSMKIYENALEQDAKYKKSKKKLTYKFESTNLIESTVESNESLTNLINDPNRKTSRIIESDDESDSNGRVEDEEKVKDSDSEVQRKKDQGEVKKEDKDSGEEQPNKLNMHKVLIFTQFQLVLDELETYCINRGWKYMRLDGSTNKLIRELDIREFNSSNSNYFVYLISTRAGGLGINLTAANHVVLYDEDWNPFIDLQAIDRAHRIGQKRNVHIWKLISEWTVEERMALIREKKLQLDKLILHNSPDSSNSEGGVESENGRMFDEDDVIISLSHAAMLKMMMHGNKALKFLEAQSITEMKLNEIIDRKRRVPPEHLDDTNDIDDILIGSSTQVADDERVIIKLVKEEDEMEIGEEDESANAKKKKVSGLWMKDLISEEDEVARPKEVVEHSEAEEVYLGDQAQSSESSMCYEVPQVKDVDHNDVGEPVDSGSRRSRRTRMVQEMEQAGLLWRSVREKKKPSLIYTPIEWQKKTEGRVLRHETKCFCCGKQKNFKTTYKDKDGNEVEVDYGDLIKCFRCPKSYHKFCERVSNIKKTWSCRWHECCLCFRKSSQCGNLLIHCSNCPTSFCYDCFPPDYTRHYVSEDYYYNLNQRGLVANNTNWIFFLCSKCKIESERKKRTISGEERDKHKKEQKQIRSELLTTIKSKEEHVSAKESRRIKSMLNKQDKKRIEDLKVQENEMEERHRQLYQSLFPINLISELKSRINTDLLNSTTQATDPKPEPEPDRRDVDAEGDEDKRDEKLSKSDKNDEDWGVGLRSKRRGLNFSNVKLPSRLLQFCDNCRIPLHNIYKYPTPCPFPKEYIKLDLEINVRKPKAPEQDEHNGKKTNSTQSGKKVGTKQQKGEESDDDNEVKGDMKDRVKKVIKKCYCSLCYEKNGTRSVHFRRHCDLLTQEDREDYRQRREKVEKAFELLTKLIPTTPNSIDYSQFNNIKLKSLYNHMLDQCDSLYLKSLITVNLLPSNSNNSSTTTTSTSSTSTTTNSSNNTPFNAAISNLSDEINMERGANLMNNYIRSFTNVYKLQNNLRLPIVYRDDNNPNSKQ